MELELVAKPRVAEECKSDDFCHHAVKQQLVVWILPSKNAEDSSSFHNAHSSWCVLLPRDKHVNLQASEDVLSLFEHLENATWNICVSKTEEVSVAMPLSQSKIQKKMSIDMVIMRQQDKILELVASTKLLWVYVMDFKLLITLDFIELSLRVNAAYLLLC